MPFHTITTTTEDSTSEPITSTRRLYMAGAAAVAVLALGYASYYYNKYHRVDFGGKSWWEKSDNSETMPEDEN